MYLANFAEKSDVAREFQIELSELEGCSIHFAAYTHEDYSGYALVIFEKDGKLFEVNGSHCSCHGLEGQWSPEETTIAALKMRDVASYGFRADLESLFVDMIFEKDVLLS